jgi:hypothetical protein
MKLKNIKQIRRVAEATYPFKKKFTKICTGLKSHVNKKLTHGHVEHHGDIWLGPRELYAEPPVLPRHAVLQRALVEEVGGELAQLGMHPVQMEFLDISLTKDSSFIYSPFYGLILK